MENRIWILGASDPEMTAIENLLRECGEKVAYALSTLGQRVLPSTAYQAMFFRWAAEKYRVQRIAPSFLEIPCCCSDETEHTVWEGTDPSQYSGGLGAFDEGCHHPSRWLEAFVGGEWIPAECYLQAQEIVLVECGLKDDNHATVVKIIDHHRPGDPGYGVPPDRAVEASSLGQVIDLLAKTNALRITSDHYGVTGQWGYDPEKTWGVKGSKSPTLNSGLYRTGFGWDWWYEVRVVMPPLLPSDDDALRISNHEEDCSCRYCVDTVYSARVPYELLVIAACDHNLGAAWAGRCHVDPGDVRAYRARLASQRPVGAISAEEYERRLAIAEQALHEASRLELEDCYCGQRLGMDCGSEGLCDDCGSTPYVEVCDLRGKFVQELPDAACSLGLAYVASVVDRDGREKVVLGGVASPNVVEAFLKWSKQQGMYDQYGDPQRGFAGAYLRRTDVNC